MPLREQDNLPYRTPADYAARSRPQQVSSNEVDYSTLKIVRDLLAEAVNGLSKDFNAFEVLKDKPENAAAKNILRQIEIKQGVYEIVFPLLTAVNEAMRGVDERYRQK